MRNVTGTPSRNPELALLTDRTGIGTGLGNGEVVAGNDKQGRCELYTAIAVAVGV